MRAALIVGVLGLALAAATASVHAAPQKDAPTLSAISATFDPGAKATYYTATFTPPGSASVVGTPTLAWSLQPPPDDPGCKRFAAMPNRASESVWYHSESDGCTHLSIEHNGTVSLQVVVVLSNDKRPWVCNASYFGTLTGTGSDAGLCTIEASATHAVVRPPINEKDKWRIVADLMDECAETETAIAAVAGAAALPTGGISAAPAVVAGGAAAGCTILARVAKRKVEDPPDRNFLALPVARAAGVPQVQPSASMPYTVAYALNSLSDNITATEGYADAFTTAINRASGAHAAGNAKAQSEQELAAATAAQAIAQLDAERPSLRIALRDAVAGAGIHLAATASQLRKARAKGLPASVVAALKQAKFPASVIAATRASAKSGTVKAVSFPADLASATAIAADRQDAAQMRAYVAFFRKSR